MTSKKILGFNSAAFPVRAGVLFESDPDAWILCPGLQLVVKFLNLMGEQYKSQRDVEFYYNALNTTYYYLNKMCRHFLGRGASGLLQERLLRECKFLLSGTLMSTKSIAFELGFSDPSNFVRFFKRHTGMTPAGFRDSLRRGLL